MAILKPLPCVVITLVCIIADPIDIYSVNIEITFVFLILLRGNFLNTKFCSQPKKCFYSLHECGQLTDWIFCQQGYEPLISVNGLHQLHILIFFLAFFHVLYSFITMMLGRLKVNELFFKIYFQCYDIYTWILGTLGHNMLVLTFWYLSIHLKSNYDWIIMHFLLYGRWW